MNLVSKMLRWFVLVFVITTISGLAGWYFFLREEQDTLDATARARGAGQIAPTFGDSFGSTYGNIVGTGTAGTATSAPQGPLPRLYQVTRAPVAGMTFITTASTTKLRFVERSTGYVLEIDVSTGVLTRLTNTLNPRTYEAMLSKNNNVIQRTDDGAIIRTKAGALVAATSSDEVGTLATTELPSGIGAIAFNATGTEIFYIAPDTSGRAAGVRAAWRGERPSTLFTSSIFGWKVQWLDDGRIVLAQKASSGVAGYAYTLGANGALNPITSPRPGLSVLPKSGSNAVLVSSAENASLTLDVERGDAVTTLPLRTLAEKCVWSRSSQLIAFCAVPQRPPINNFLDLWNRGAVHTSDQWWRVDAATGGTELVYSAGDTELDAIRPVIDDEGKYIAFLNYRDLSLWLLRIAQ